MVKNLVPYSYRVTSPAVRLEEEFENLFESFFGPAKNWTPSISFAPRTNIAETEDDFQISFELPGLKPENVNVELKDGELWITGKKEEEKEEKGKTFLRKESHYGEFRRVVSLSTAIDEDSINADYKDGILKVVLPKAAEFQPKKIEVKS